MNLFNHFEQANPEKLEPDNIELSSTKEKQKEIRFPKRFSRNLIYFLWFRIGFDLLFVLYCLMWVSANYVYDMLDTTDTTQLFTYLIDGLMRIMHWLWRPIQQLANWIVPVTVLIILVWIHRLHASLKVVFKGYPIKPWDAILRLVLPIYCIWGMGSLFSTLASQLRSQGSPIARWGTALRRCIPWLYLATFATNGFTKYEEMQYRVGNESELPPWFFLASNSFTLLESVVWLLIIWNIYRGMIETLNKEA